MKKQESNKEKKFTSQGWKRVLNEISNYAPKRYERKANYDKKYPLVKRAKVKPYELPSILDFLKEQGSIEYNNSEGNLIKLTPKGLHVALQNQSAAKADKVNRATVFFTLVIAVTATIGLLAGIEDYLQRTIISSLFVFAVVFGGLTISRYF